MAPPVLTFDTYKIGSKNTLKIISFIQEVSSSMPVRIENCMGWEEWEAFTCPKFIALQYAFQKGHCEWRRNMESIIIGLFKLPAR
jgi:hypothetical protein